MKKEEKQSPSKTIAVLGGDKRNTLVAKNLIDLGYKVNFFACNGFDLDIKQSKNLKSALKNADYVVGPIIATNDGISLFTQFYDGQILLKDIFKQTKNKVFICGCSDRIKHTPERIEIVDVLKNNKLAVKNAWLTAEATLKIAIEDLDISVKDLDILVIGHGKVGKEVAKIFDVLKSNVTVCVKEIYKAETEESYNYNIVTSNMLKQKINKFKLVINTAPTLVLNKDVLKQVEKDTLIIDLASKPGGVDYEEATKLNLHAVHALGLPGKISPISAANVITEIVLDTIKSTKG